MSKRAIILAGGKGTRLKPYTVVLPKPLMPVGDYPILEVIIRQLSKAGFDHITMAVNHQADIIKAYFGDGSRWNLKIDYSFENKPLSTMGPLSLIDDLPDNFLVMNGDILSDIDYGAFYTNHEKRESVFTVSTYIREHINLYGVIETDATGHLSEFREKPISRFQVSMGIYMANRSVLSLIPRGESYGFDTLMLDLLAKKTPAYIEEFKGYWLDIGRPDDYIQAIEEFEKRKAQFLG